MASKLCPYCMKMTEGNTCHHCGKQTDYSGLPMHLPAGYVVSGVHPYVLGAALGQGGFGITYIALDMITNQRVAIKEYYPTYCSARTENSNVTAYSNQEEVYLKGKERFLDEARTLKSLSDLKNIVNVLDFFEANNSAYLVMEFLEGSSLKEYAAKNGRFPAQQFLKQIKPLMEDIHRMHERGVIHRDIAPDNIILLPDGQMKLIDFGAARSYVGDKSMTVVVKKGFAPVEQYMSKGSSASTDVYALAATIYYCITGTVPPDSAERQYDDVPLQSPTALGADITPAQEKALLHALNVQQKARTQTVQEFLEKISRKEPEKPIIKPKPVPPDPPPRNKLPIILAAVAVLVLAVGFFLFSGTRDTPAAQPNEKPALEAAAATEASIETAPPAPTEPADRITENVDLTVLAAQYGNRTASWWADFEKDFEAEYPMVDLKVDVASWNDIYTITDTRIAVGEAPDILNIDIFADYQDSGILLPVQDYMSEETYAKFYPQFLEQSLVDGKVWAVPDLASVRALFYNKRMFEECGLEPPTTWEELKNVCKVIRQNYPKVRPIGLDMTTDDGHTTFACFALSNGGGLTDSSGNWNLNCEENAQALSFLNDLVKSGYTESEPTIHTRWALQDMFVAEEIAMMLSPDSLSGICEDAGIAYGVVPIPAGDGNKSSTIAVMDRFMCFDNDYSDSELAAVTCFFDFFYDDQRYSEWVTMEGFLPATSTGNTYLAAADPNKAAWNEVLASSTFHPAAKSNWAAAKNGIIDALQRTLLGSDPQSLLNSLQKQLAP